MDQLEREKDVEYCCAGKGVKFERIRRITGAI